MKMNHTNFDTIAEQYEEEISETKKYITLPLFREIIGNIRGKRVADVGCGNGFFTRILVADKPSLVMGIDISSKLLEKALQREQQEQRGILYQCQDVRFLEKKESFDIITAVYLLNFAETKEDLLLMLKSINNNLNTKGKFCAIIPHPKIKPTSDFEFGRKITSASGKKTFENDQKVFYEIASKKENVKIVYTYWSKETYENCLRRVGFTKIEWQEPTITAEAINQFGKEYWSNYQQNPSSIGVVCWKE